MYIAKVNIETATKEYKPGEKVKGLSAADIAFLKKHNFIMDEEDFPDVKDGEDGDCADTALVGLQAGNGIPGITPPDTDGDAPGVGYKDEPALKRMNKQEIVGYAKSIGLSLNEEMLKPDLIDAVLNYVGERETAAKPE